MVFLKDLSNFDIVDFLLVLLVRLVLRLAIYRVIK